MRARFNDPSFFHHYYLIKLKQGYDPVSNNDSRFVLQVLMQVIKNFLFCTRIHSTQAIIENDDFRLFDEGPCNGNALFFAG